MERFIQPHERDTHPFEDSVRGMLKDIIDKHLGRAA